jgi:hypothetical protein
VAVLWKAVDFYVYVHECISLDEIFTASDRIIPMVEQMMSEKEHEVEEGTHMTMDTTLGLHEPVSHFFHIIFKTIYSCVYASTCVCVCVCVCKTCF